MIFTSFIVHDIHSKLRLEFIIYKASHLADIATFDLGSVLIVIH